MRFYSTNNKKQVYSLREAVLKSLPDDNGLFMPETIPQLPSAFWTELTKKNFQEIAFDVSWLFLSGDIPEDVIHKIAFESVNFPVPLVAFDNLDIAALELFHGPTLAFKDVGARFMARVMAYLNRNEKKKLTILVATSGDTGSAVANGFHNVEGIEVIILYPSGKVSPLQEKQLTTLGGNITAIEITGAFDDCQKLVKTAFLDETLRSVYRLSSANSINIARLIPQSIYYIEAYRQVADPSLPVLFSVPSGNFGNLTAGLLAKRMGLPVHRFIASTNVNDSVPRYLESSKYEPHQTIATISNAMDVGNPSNFARMLDLYGNDVDSMRADISAYSFTDDETRNEMRRVYNERSYILDPHGAVALLGLEKYIHEHPGKYRGIFLETAHPAKFIEVVEETLKIKLPVPKELAMLTNRPKESLLMEPDYDQFRDYLLGRK